MFFLCKQQLLFFGDLKPVSEKLAFYLQMKNLEMCQPLTVIASARGVECVGSDK